MDGFPEGEELGWLLEENNRDGLGGQLWPEHAAVTVTDEGGGAAFFWEGQELVAGDDIHPPRLQKGRVVAHRAIVDGAGFPEQCGLEGGQNVQ